MVLCHSRALLDTLQQDQTIIWAGDQLTVSCLHGLQKFHYEDHNSFDHLDFLVPVSGWFHAQMAVEHSIHVQYYGTNVMNEQRTSIFPLFHLFFVCIYSTLVPSLVVVGFMYIACCLSAESPLILRPVPLSRPIRHPRQDHIHLHRSKPVSSQAKLRHCSALISCSSSFTEPPLSF